MTKALLSALVGEAEIESFFTDEADLHAMLTFESSLARVEAKIGLVPKESALCIVKTCGSFTPDWKRLTEGFAKDGVIVPELVAQLRRGVGEPHARFVHVGATSQDVIDTSLMLRLKQIIKILKARLATLVERLNQLVQSDGAKPLMAHTRMQRALPFTVADKLKTWTHPLVRLRQELLALEPRLLVIQFGGPVGTRGGLEEKGDTIARALAVDIGLGYGPVWHSNRDLICAFGSWLSLVSGTLGKIGEDVALMAQIELNEIRLAGGGGSSAMPHKSNPIPAEILVALARFNAGLLGTLHQSLVHENERSGAAWTLEWLVLPQMVVATAAGLRHALGLARNLAFNDYPGH